MYNVTYQHGTNVNKFNIIYVTAESAECISKMQSQLANTPGNCFYVHNTLILLIYCIHRKHCTGQSN